MIISNRREKLKSIGDHVSIFSRLERTLCGANDFCDSSGHAVIARQDCTGRDDHDEIISVSEAGLGRWWR